VAVLVAGLAVGSSGVRQGVGTIGGRFLVGRPWTRCWDVLCSWLTKEHWGWCGRCSWIVACRFGVTGPGFGGGGQGSKRHV